MDNIIGIAKSYLEGKGIDTRDMTIEEIIALYNELIAEEGEEEPAEEVAEEVAEDKTELEKLLEENQDIINGLDEAEKALFDKIIALIA